MKEENIGVLSAGERFGFKGFEWIVLDNNVDGGVLAIMASAWNNEEYSFDDDGCNNYAKSSLRRKLITTFTTEMERTATIRMSPFPVMLRSLWYFWQRMRLA